MCLLFYIYICVVMQIGLQGCSHLLVCKAISFLSFSRNLAPFSRNFVSLSLNFNLFSRSFVPLSSCFIPFSHLFVLYLYTIYHDTRITYRLNFCIRNSRSTSTKNIYRVLWHSGIPTVKVSLTFYRCSLPNAGYCESPSRQ